jgi:hypothetical protein
MPSGRRIDRRKTRAIDGNGKQLLKPRCNYRLPRRNAL